MSKYPYEGVGLCLVGKACLTQVKRQRKRFRFVQDVLCTNKRVKAMNAYSYNVGGQL